MTKNKIKLEGECCTADPQQDPLLLQQDPQLEEQAAQRQEQPSTPSVAHGPSLLDLR
jgi:hypothetical protein